MNIIFVLNGIEKVIYDLENSFDGELKATKELIAYENNCHINDIKTYYQKNYSFTIRLYRNKSFKMY